MMFNYSTIRTRCGTLTIRGVRIQFQNRMDQLHTRL